ncbi:UNVERIFIED_CONTAM: hypothetical protein GTU68_055727 [Idotea baltica]|nr:hypothetical protein [Idotea baltica]
MINNNIFGIGKRKTSVARVYLNRGKGKLLITNKKNALLHKKTFHKIYQPLIITATQKIFDIQIDVRGGGFQSQINAVQLGISKALTLYNPALQHKLKLFKLLTQDSRKVERKKVGHLKSRKKRQFSKR